MIRDWEEKLDKRLTNKNDQNLIKKIRGKLKGEKKEYYKKKTHY